MHTARLRPGPITPTLSKTETESPYLARLSSFHIAQHQGFRGSRYDESLFSQHFHIVNFVAQFRLHQNSFPIRQILHNDLCWPDISGFEFLIEDGPFQAAIEELDAAAKGTLKT